MRGLELGCANLGGAVASPREHFDTGGAAGVRCGCAGRCARVLNSGRHPTAGVGRRSESRVLGGARVSPRECFGTRGAARGVAAGQ